MHLLDTFEGTLKDAMQWAENLGMPPVRAEQIAARVFLNKEASWLRENHPEQYFRFMSVFGMDIVNVGLWQIF